MLKQHGIQKSHARENVLHDVIMRRSTRSTRFRIKSLFMNWLSTMTLRNYHSDSVCLTKVNFTTSLLIFFFLDELIQVETGNHQTGTTVIQQNVSSPV